MNILKKQSLSFSGIMLSLLCAIIFSMPSRAASIDGLNGEWGVKLATTYTVKGFGTRRVKDSGKCTITLLNNISTGFVCGGFNESKGQNYIGGMSVPARGSKLNWGLDSGVGLDQVKANMTGWLIGKNTRKGRQLDPQNVTYQFYKTRYKPIELSKSRNEPEVMRGVIQGQVTQMVNGTFIVKPFTYKLKIKFLSKVG